MKIQAIELLQVGKDESVLPGDVVDSKKINLSDKDVEALIAAGAVRVAEAEKPAPQKPESKNSAGSEG